MYVSVDIFEEIGVGDGWIMLFCRVCDCGWSWYGSVSFCKSSGLIDET